MNRPNVDLSAHTSGRFPFSGEMEKIIKYEAELLAQRIKNRKENLFFSFFAFTHKRKYPNTPAYEVISAEFKKYITTPEEEIKLLKSYLSSRAHYGLFLFSEEYIFIRHAAGLSILELSSITDITASKSRMGCTTITFSTPNPIAFDFLNG